MAHTPGQVLLREKRRCSCQISAVGPLDTDTYIQYCPLHFAAPSLLAALRICEQLFEAENLALPKEARAAIARATGKASPVLDTGEATK